MLCFDLDNKNIFCSWIVTNIYFKQEENKLVITWGCLFADNRELSRYSSYPPAIAKWLHHTQSWKMDKTVPTCSSQTWVNIRITWKACAKTDSQPQVYWIRMSWARVKFGRWHRCAPSLVTMDHPHHGWSKVVNYNKSLKMQIKPVSFECPKPK